MPKIIQILYRGRHRKRLWGLDDEGRVWLTAPYGGQWEPALDTLDEIVAEIAAKDEADRQADRAERIRCGLCPECGAMLEKREDGSPICVVCTVRAAEDAMSWTDAENGG